MVGVVGSSPIAPTSVLSEVNQTQVAQKHWHFKIRIRLNPIRIFCFCHELGESTSAVPSGRVKRRPIPFIACVN